MVQANGKLPATAWQGLAGEGWRLVRFGIVGLTVTVIYLVVALLLTRQGGLAPAVASVIAHVVAMLASYLGHKYVTFLAPAQHLRHALRFIAATALAFGLNIGVTWLFVDALLLRPEIAFATLAVLIPVMNYVTGRFWVFAPARPRA